MSKLSCSENPEKVEKRFVEIWPKLDEIEGMSGFRGECGDFAYALKELVGGEAWCSYPSKARYIEGSPSHCALKCGDFWADREGEIKGKPQLKGWAMSQRRRSGKSQVEAEKDVVIKKVEPKDFRKIHNEERFERYKEELSNIIEEKGEKNVV